MNFSIDREKEIGETPYIDKKIGLRIGTRKREM